MFWIAVHSPGPGISSDSPTRPPPMGTPVWGPRRRPIWGGGGLLCVLCSSGKDGVHGPLQTPGNRRSVALFHKPQAQERQGREKVPSVKPAMAVSRGDGETGACGVHGRPLTAAAGELGLSEDSRAPEVEERGGMGQGASHPCAGPAGSVHRRGQVPRRSGGVRGRHLLDCSVRCAAQWRQALREARRQAAYSVLGFRSSTTEGRGRVGKVLADLGWRGERPDGERQTDRQTDIRERDRHRPTE